MENGVDEWWFIGVFVSRVHDVDAPICINTKHDLCQGLLHEFGVQLSMRMHYACVQLRMSMSMSLHVYNWCMCLLCVMSVYMVCGHVWLLFS